MQERSLWFCNPLWFLEVWVYIKIKCFDTNVSEAPFCDILSRIRMNILGYKLIQRRTERKMNFKARTLLTFSVKIFSAPRLNLSFKVALSCVDESYLNRHIHHDNFSATPHSNRQKSGVSTLVISFKEHTAPVWLPMVTYIQFRTETGCELKTVGWDTDCPV